MATHIQIKCADDVIGKGLRFAATACGMSLRQYTLYAAAKHTARLFAGEPWGFGSDVADALRSGAITDDERRAEANVDSNAERLQQLENENSDLQYVAQKLRERLLADGMTDAAINALVMDEEPPF